MPWQPFWAGLELKQADDSKKKTQKQKKLVIQGNKKSVRGNFVQQMNVFFATLSFLFSLENWRKKSG